MKKFVLISLCFVLTLALTACGEVNQESQIGKNQQEVSDWIQDNSDVPIENDNSKLIEDDIHKLRIYGVANGENEEALYIAEVEKDISDEIVSLYNQSNDYSNDVGTTHPIRVELLMSNGKTLYLLYGTQGFITVLDGSKQYNIQNAELEDFFNLLFEDGIDNSYDINKGNGNIINILMGLVEGEIPIGDLTEEFNLPYDDQEYKLKMFTTTDEYMLVLKENGVPIDSIMDYSKSELVITNNTDNWTLNNPTSEQIDEMMMEEYYAQIEDWREDNVVSRYRGNFIYIQSPNGLHKIDLDDEIADRIAFELKAASDSIVINDYRSTEEEFHMKGIDVFLEDLNYEYPVPLWINYLGVKAIGFANEPIPVSERAYNMLLEVAKTEMNYQEGDIKDLDNLISIELKFNGDSIATVTNSNNVKEIEKLLTGSEIMNGIGKCPFGAELIMTRADGKTVTAVLPTDSCGYFILGTATCYIYDREDSKGLRKYEQKDLLKYFGINSFSDISD